MKMERIIIEHNHGHIALCDAEMTPYEYTNQFGTHQCNIVKGTVESGYSTNRLFHATSTTHEKVGEVKEVDIWGRKPYKCADGTWRVSIVTCG